MADRGGSLIIDQANGLAIDKKKYLRGKHAEAFGRRNPLPKRGLRLRATVLSPLFLLCHRDRQVFCLENKSRERNSEKAYGSSIQDLGTSG
jgi:hypothetical protein